jgi:DnaJ-class molecular chaperone
VSPAETETEIRALARMLDRVDYYRLLKVERRAPLPQIRKAYHQARRRFDPDSFLQAHEDVRSAVDKIARRITEGYLVLRDAKRRSAYDNALSGGTVRYTPELEEAAVGADEAEGTTPNGKRFLAMAEDEARQANWKAAVQHMKMALTWEPSNEAFKARLSELQSRAAG